MKYMILSLLATGVVFSSPQTNEPSKTFEGKTAENLSPTRSMKSIDISLGAITSKDLGDKVIPRPDLSLSYRSPILLLGDSSFGNGHRISLGLSPTENLYGLTMKPPFDNGYCYFMFPPGIVDTYGASLSYQNNLYYKAKDNFSPYIGVGGTCQFLTYREIALYSIDQPEIIRAYFPGVVFAIGAECNKRTKHPYFVEAGVTVARTYIEHDKKTTKKENTIYPKITCGYGF